MFLKQPNSKRNASIHSDEGGVWSDVEDMSGGKNINSVMRWNIYKNRLGNITTFFGLTFRGTPAHKLARR